VKANLKNDMAEAEESLKTLEFQNQSNGLNDK
jgi:hypothetical protein